MACRLQLKRCSPRLTWAVFLLAPLREKPGTYNTKTEEGAKYCSKVSGTAECMMFKIPSSDCGESCC